LLPVTNTSKKSQKIPDSAVIEGLEILVGALVWILPIPGTKQLGGFMIGDGIRRVFDSVEEQSKKIRKIIYNHSLSYSTFKALHLM